MLLIKVGEPGRGAEFPLIGEPGIKVALGPGGEVHEQLREVKLRIKVVPAASGSQAGKDRSATTAARVADEKAVFPIEHHPLHLAF